ncbi:MAG: hypothetical protein ACOCU1_03180, partial [Bacillota bacterium]
MKKLFILLTLLVSLLTLTACELLDEVTVPEQQDDDTQVVEEDNETHVTLDVISSVDNVNYTLSDDGPYEVGDNVTITIESLPSSWEFSHYEDATGIVSSASSYTFTIDEDMTLEIVLDALEDSAIESFYTAASFGDTVTLEGTVFAAYDGGYYITDGQFNVNIYDDNLSAVPGDTVSITGTVSQYYTMMQLTEVTETILTTNDTLSYPVYEASLSEILALDATSDPTVSGRVYSVTATLNTVTNGQYTNLVLTDGNEEITIYYNASQTALNALNAYVGQTIEIDVLYYTDHESDGVYMLFYGDDNDITVID